MVDRDTEGTATAPNKDEQRLAADGAARLARLTQRPRAAAAPKFRIVVDGPESNEEVHLPNPVVCAAIEAMEHVANGYAVAVVPLNNPLTSTQVARLLNVSRPYAARLMDEDEIPSHRAGTHRRAYLADVMAYKRRMDQRADEAYEQMVALTESQDLYHD